jgi:hypothetical protein
MVMVVALTGRASSQEYDAEVTRDVEVRSGPSSNPSYYPTGKLRAGEKVRVKGNHGEFVAIAPPRDAFSLVTKQAIQPLPGGGGVVKNDVEAVDTYQGSLLVGTCNVKGTRLLAGAQVTILEEVQIPSNVGKSPFYKIVPLNEVRYIPTAAIRKQEVVQAGGGNGPPATGGVQQASGGVPREELGARLNQAEHAYRRGQATGEWDEAKRLYTDIALRSDDYQARLLAENRLSYIKKRAPGLFAPGASAANQPRYNSGPASSYDRSRPPVEPVPPATLSGFRPPSPQVLPARGNTSGTLKRTATREQGRPVYSVVDDQGRTKFFVVGSTGLDLESLVDQKLEVTGGPMVYRQDLQGHYMVAVSARRAP